MQAGWRSPAGGWWFTQIGLVGGFSLLLALGLVIVVAGYAVIRRATPRG
jgi:hypothetical protein